MKVSSALAADRFGGRRTPNCLSHRLHSLSLAVLQRSAVRFTDCDSFCDQVPSDKSPGYFRSSAPCTHVQACLHSQATAENRQSPKVWRNQTAAPDSPPTEPCECY